MMHAWRRVWQEVLIRAWKMLVPKTCVSKERFRGPIITCPVSEFSLGVAALDAFPNGRGICSANKAWCIHPPFRASLPISSPLHHLIEVKLCIHLANSPLAFVSLFPYLPCINVGHHHPQISSCFTTLWAFLLWRWIQSVFCYQSFHCARILCCWTT